MAADDSNNVYGPENDMLLPLCDGSLITMLDLSNSFVVQMESDVLRTCRALQTIKFPRAVREVAPSCLSNLAQLKLCDMSICSQLEVVPERLCFGSGRAKGMVVYLPARCLFIEDFAFANSGLSGLFVPSTCSHIGSGVFSRCRRLRQIEFAGEIPFLEAELFGSTPCILKGLRPPKGESRCLLPITTKTLRPLWLLKLMFFNRLSDVGSYRSEHAMRSRLGSKSAKDSEVYKERRNRKCISLHPLPVEILEMIFNLTSDWPKGTDDFLFFPNAYTKLSCERLASFVWHDFRPKLWLALVDMSNAELENAFRPLGLQYKGRRSRYRTIVQIYNAMSKKGQFPLWR